MPLPIDPYTLASKYFACQIEEDEQRRFSQWREAHPEEFEILRKLWFQHLVPESPFRLTITQQKLNQRIDALEAENYQAKPRSTPAYWIAASIGALLLLAAAYLVLPGAHPTKQVHWLEKITSKSQVATFTLADGSQVTLNADTQLRYSLSTTTPTREVFLEGEAFFQISPDPDRPFIVHSGALSTQVVGTSFSVSAYPEDDVAKVTVASGRVAVDLPDSSSSLLRPDRQGVYHLQERTWSERTVEMAHELAWTEGRLVFDQTQLSQVARMLERYYDVSVVFETDNLNYCQVTGSFERETLFHVLKSISYINALTYTFEDGVVTFSGSGCSPK